MGARQSNLTPGQILPAKSIEDCKPKHDGEDPPPPKLKILVGYTTRNFYIRKEWFGAGNFGRVYACLDQSGNAYAIKEVRLTKPKNPDKVPNPSRNDVDALRTRSITPGFSFENEIKLSSNLAESLSHSPWQAFTNALSTKGYVVQSIMSGTGEELMGHGRQLGLLPQEFKKLRGNRKDIRESAIFRDVARRLASCGKEIHAKNIILSDIKPAKTMEELLRGVQ